MTVDGPFEKFCDEIEEVVDRWRDKPDDDQLTRAQVVGAFEFVKLKVMQEAAEMDLE
ncbi:MAG: hypothetical protein RIB60_06110 [Phycisphaerales bacterium]